MEVVGEVEKRQVDGCVRAVRGGFGVQLEAACGRVPFPAAVLFFFSLKKLQRGGVRQLCEAGLEGTTCGRSDGQQEQATWTKEVPKIGMAAFSS